MTDTRASRSAQGVALIRAIETQRPAAERICTDPLARALIPGGISYYLSKLAVDLGVFERMAPGAASFIAIRERYIDDLLIECLAQGCAQVVILGAGLDSRAFRIPGIERARVFEVDQAETQSLKRQRLRRVIDPIPPHISFISVDFNTQQLGQRLAEGGYREQATTLFIWQGVTYFLTDQGVDSTLAFIAQHAGRGSQVVFDYCYSEMLRDTGQGYGKALRRASRISGETYLFGIDEGHAAGFLTARGFCNVRDESIEQIGARYLTGPSAGRTVAKGIAIATAAVCEKKQP